MHYTFIFSLLLCNSVQFPVAHPENPSPDNTHPDDPLSFWFWLEEYSNSIAREDLEGSALDQEEAVEMSDVEKNRIRQNEIDEEYRNITELANSLGLFINIVDGTYWDSVEQTPSPPHTRSKRAPKPMQWLGVVLRATASAAKATGRVAVKAVKVGSRMAKNAVKKQIRAVARGINTLKSTPKKALAAQTGEWLGKQLVNQGIQT